MNAHAHCSHVKNNTIDLLKKIVMVKQIDTLNLSQNSIGLQRLQILFLLNNF